MKSFFARVILVAFLALFGVSVLDIALPTPFLFPVVLFSVAVSLSLTRGFVGALPSVVMIGLVCDVAALGRLGLSSAFCAGLAYTVGFLSRRFAVEHGFMMHLFAGLVVGAGTLVFLTVSPWFDGVAPGRMLDGVGWGSVPLTFGAGLLVFPLVSTSMRRLEDWLSYFDSPNAF